MKKSLVYLSFILAIGALFATGCQNKDQGIEAPKGGESPAGTSENSTPAPKTDAEDVTAEMKNDGYMYYGLGNSKKLVYDFTLNGTTEEGTQVTEYQGKQDGVPTYKMTRTGSLSDMGDETLQLTEKGIMLTDTSMGKLGESVIALPAKIAVGDTWNTSQTITRVDGKELKMEVTYKVEKEGKVSVPGGEFDCITISSKGTTEMDGKKSPFSGTVSYSKGVGVVKLQIDPPAETSNSSGAVVILKKVE